MRTDLATGRSAGPLLWLKMHRLLEYCLGGSIICGGCLQVVGVCLPRMWYLWAVPLLCAFNSPCCSTFPLVNASHQRDGCCVPPVNVMWGPCRRNGSLGWRICLKVLWVGAKELLLGLPRPDRHFRPGEGIQSGNSRPLDRWTRLQMNYWTSTWTHINAGSHCLPPISIDSSEAWIPSQSLNVNQHQQIRRLPLKPQGELM